MEMEDQVEEQPTGENDEVMWINYIGGKQLGNWECEENSWDSGEQQMKKRLRSLVSMKFQGFQPQMIQ